MKKILIYLAVAILLALAIFFAFYETISNGKVSQKQQGSICLDCNVILISVDTLGAKHLGLYGYDKNTSPFLDQLSQKQGIVFKQAIAQSSWTLPSHAAMLTSQHPWDLNIWTPLDALPEDALTIAEVLQEKGYVTQAFSNGAFVQPEFRFDKGFDDFQGSATSDSWDDMPKIFNDSLGWLEAKDNSDPFFLFIHSFHVHDPYTPEGEDLNEFYIGDIVKANIKTGGPTAQDISMLQDSYDAEIKEFDIAFKDFFTSLQTLGLLDNTLIILTADHGEGFGEHNTVAFHSINLYSELTQVPLIIFLPNQMQAQIEDVVEVRSIPPTVIDLLGYKKISSFADISLLPNINGQASFIVAESATSLDHKYAFEAIEKAYADIDKIGKEIYPIPRIEDWAGLESFSARTSDWHLIYNFIQEFELYNLKVDPLEQVDLFLDWQTLPQSDQQQISSLLEIINENISK